MNSFTGKIQSIVPMVIRFWKLGLTVFTLCVVISSVTAQSNKQVIPGIPDVFSAGDSVMDRQLTSPVFKRRTAHINFDVLSGARARGRMLHFNLFPDLTFDATVESTEARGVNDYTLTGRLADHPDSSFALSVKDGVMIANFRPIGGKLYTVRYFGNGLHDLNESDATKYPPCTTGPEQEVRVTASNPAVQKDDPADSGVVAPDAGDKADVIVLYTPGARAAAGGTAAMQALINLAVSEANTAYQQSQINLQLRLVFQSEIPFFGDNLDSSNLNSLSNNGQVQALRNAYGADLVSLMVNDSSSCGLGYVMTGSASTNFASSGFTLVHWDCATGYYSYAHELGHNMGCAHDYAGGGNGLYPYSHGHHFTGGGINYRSIMSYGSETRVQRFSNPNVTYAGASTGVATNLANPAHNALTINNTAPFVTNFRQSVSTSSIPAMVFGQPGSASISSGGSTTFTVLAAGTPPLFYQWRRGGAAIPGATSSSYLISNAEGYQVGSYSVVVSNAFGSAVSANATLTITGIPSLDAALDNPGLPLSLSGDFNWWAQAGVTHDGVDAAATGLIADNQSSRLGATFTGPGTLRFWWKASTELNYDFLRFYTNGITYSNAGPVQISGEQNWTQVIVPLAPGNQICEWRYLKDISLSGGQDRVWLDEVVFTAAIGLQADTMSIESDGFMQFKISGDVGSHCLIQVSTNLINWESLTNAVVTNGRASFFDPVTNLSSRFYRVVSP
jgi:hypothetical protein